MVSSGYDLLELEFTFPTDQEKKIITQEKAKERKLRTKRLIEIGGTAESILGRPFQDDDLQKFANFLKQQEARGNYYSKAMNNTNTQ